jgi:hypothetical protein
MTAQIKNTIALIALFQMLSIAVMIGTGLMFNDRLSSIENIVEGNAPIVEHHKAKIKRIFEGG